MDWYDKACGVFFLVLIGLLVILSHARHDTANERLDRLEQAVEAKP